jgi:UPF0755 protein
MKKVLIVLAVLVVIAVLGVIGVYTWYNIQQEAVDKSSEDTIRVEIPEKTNLEKIASILEEKGVIRNAFVMKVYCKLNKINNLQAGKYDLAKNEGLADILKHLQDGDVAHDEIKITFIEGKNMRWVAKRIAEKTPNTEEEVFALLEDEAYIDSLIEKYWFLTDVIKDENIYYPLEGYLMPDTYLFEQDDCSVKTIFSIMLNSMDKFLAPYKESIENSGYTVHELLTLASMAELEAHLDEDRAEVVGVFLNRIKKKMSLGSDVTTYYAAKVDMAERDLYKKELNAENPYNTRGPNMIAKLPIGPICNPSISSIKAAFNPKETTALFFVSDKNNKTYFSDTEAEQQKVIKDLKANGMWYTYDN